ncbi:hypothetical protein ACFL34_04655 [Candidatus Sumerlaeota bacterium]
MTIEADDNQQDQENGPEARVSREAFAPFDIALASVGAILGGVVGYWLCYWAAGQGFYTPILPGALVGLGCGSLSGRYSRALGIVCGVLGLVFGLYTEWQIRPFIADKSLAYFLAHLHQLTQLSQVMIVIGAILAYWFGVGRPGGSWPRETRR